LDRFVPNLATGGVNLIDTAEQYPIPSDPRQCPEGSTEALIGEWLAQGGAQKASRRDKVKNLKNKDDNLPVLCIHMSLCARFLDFFLLDDHRGS